MTQALRKAEKLFETFHQFESMKVGDFARGFSIPREANHVGEAKTMFYSSDKLNPETGEDEGVIHYFHEHEGDVKMYVLDESRDGEWRKVPKWIWGSKALVKLGDCEGFEYEDFDGTVAKAEATGKKPEWYCTPSGKAILVIQNKAHVLAIAWGGGLNVEWRGVVG
jgi:hypothetical protein